MKYLNPDGSEVDPTRDDWKLGYEDSSSSGLTCLICHALVPAFAEHAVAHRRWHEQGGPHGGS